MARVQYGGGVTEFTGSLAGNTFQRTASGPIVRSRRTNARRSTPLMSNVQQQTFALLQLWRSLIESQQTAWNDFAALHTKTNLFGQEKILSGFNWFTSINSNLRLVGESDITTPPAFTGPTAIDTAELVALAGSLTLSYTMTETPDKTQLIILSTGPLQGTTLSFRQHLRYTHQFEPVEADDLDFSDAWESAHHLTFPPSATPIMNIGAVAYTIQTDTGLTSPGTFVQTKWTPS